MSLKIRVKFNILHPLNKNYFPTFYGKDLEDIELQCKETQKYLKATYSASNVDVSYEFT